MALQLPVAIDAFGQRGVNRAVGEKVSTPIVTEV